jgi:hypothetical protein
MFMLALLASGRRSDALRGRGTERSLAREEHLSGFGLYAMRRSGICKSTEYPDDSRDFDVADIVGAE